MKLLLVTEFFPADLNLKFTGGVEARTFYLARFLAKNNRVMVICRKTSVLTESKKIANILVYPCGVKVKNIEANIFSVLERVFFIITAFFKGLKLEFDLVEGSNFVSYLPAFFLGFFKKKPKIAWYADVFKGKWINNFGLTGFFGEVIERLSLILPWEKVIALSQNTKNRLIASGINKNKITVVYGGVEFKKLKIQNSKFQPKAGQPRAEKVKNILCISRLVKYKRVNDLINAFLELAKRYLNITLTIIGQGPEEEKLKKLVKDKNLEKKVFFLKNLTRNDLIKTLKQSYLFCLPSIIEGFGLVTIEAAVYGLPYVISDILTNKEITQSGKGGLLFKQENVSDLVNKIETLLKDKILYRQKQKEALILAKHYNWDTLAKQTEKIYQNCLTNN